jgi:hypothetical protein
VALAIRWTVVPPVLPTFVSIYQRLSLVFRIGFASQLTWFRQPLPRTLAMSANCKINIESPAKLWALLLKIVP